MHKSGRSFIFPNLNNTIQSSFVQNCTSSALHHHLSFNSISGITDSFRDYNTGLSKEEFENNRLIIEITFPGIIRPKVKSAVEENANNGG